MRIIVCGTRSVDTFLAKSLIAQALEETAWHPDEIISGGAPGADTAARDFAKENGIDFVEIVANWRGHNKAAGYKRNQKMAWYALTIEESLTLKGIEVSEKYKPACIAIWNGSSVGTKHMIDIAREKNIPVKIMQYPLPSGPVAT